MGPGICVYCAKIQDGGWRGEYVYILPLYEMEGGGASMCILYHYTRWRLEVRVCVYCTTIGDWRVEDGGESMCLLYHDTRRRVEGRVYVNCKLCRMEGREASMCTLCNGTRLRIKRYVCVYSTAIQDGGG